MIIRAEKLRALVSGILRHAGVRKEEAELVSGNFVESNLVGHDSHGVIQIPRYIKAIREGRINIEADVRVVKEHAGIVVIDADWGFGQVAATKAMDTAVIKAGKHGVASGSVFNCNDVSRLGAYSVRAVEHHCIGIITVNDGGANPYVVPWGGKNRLFSTNPISAAIPMRGRLPVCIDMATSVVAGGKIALARKRGEKLPDGCIIDADGKPSIDPNDFFGLPAGALLPLGGLVAGHKGFALSLLVDILSGALSGAGCSGSGAKDNQGVFVTAINITAFTELDDFFNTVEQLVERIKSTAKAEGVEEILVPGEPEWRQREKRLKEGIFIEDVTWKELTEIAEQFGVKRDRQQ